MINRIRLSVSIAALCVATSNLAFAAAEADLLVAYDNGYSDGVGGDDNAEVLAANSVAASNLINDRSGTGARIRVAGYHKTWWQAGRSSLGGYVGWMNNYGDGELNDVTTAADARGADLVAFICEPAAGEGAAAVAYQPGRYAAYGPGNFWANIVAHETGGHNYGCDHRGGRENPKTIMMHNYCGGGSQGFYSNPNLWLNGARLVGEGSCLGAAVDGGDNAYLISSTCQGVADRNARVITAPSLGNVVRRWAFNQAAGSAPAGTSVTDSVSGTELATVQGNGAAFTGSGLRTPGGASGSGAAYLQLPGGVLSAYTNVTIEIWAKELSAQNWARLVDFNNGTANYIMLAACRGTDLNLQRFESAFSGTYVGLDSDIPTTAGVLHHYAITYTSTGASTGRWTWYRDGDQVAWLDVASPLSALQDVNNWLGRSAYGSDAFAHCEYQEVRVSNVAMSRDQIAANARLGANRQSVNANLTADDPVNQSSFNAAGLWSDGLAPSAGKSYETYGFRLRTPVDGTSRTFAGQSLRLLGGSFTWKGTSSSTITVNDLTLAGTDGELLNAGSGTWTLAGNLKVEAPETMVRAANGPINLSASLSGGGDLLHVNNTVTLSGNNTNFTGKTIVGDGRFSSIAIDSEARLGANPTNFTADQLTLNRGVFYNSGSVTLSNANRGIRIGASAGIFNVAPGTTLTLAVPLSSPTSGSALVTTPLFPNPVYGMLIKDNTGTLVLTHPNNSHVGEILIHGGGITVQGAGRLNNGDLAMPIVNNGTLTFNTTANQILGGAVSGAGSLVKVNSGILTLYAANTYLGDTIVGGGTLALNGSGSLLSPNILVSNGATFNVSAVSFTLGSGVALKGGGTINGNVTTAATASLQPGFGAGTLTFSNTLNMNAGGSATFELGTVAASGNDRIVVGGNLTLSGADTIRISALSGVADLDISADYVLFSVSGTTTLAGTPSLVWDGTKPANFDHYYLAKVGNNIVLRYTAAVPPAITAVGNPAVSVRNQAVTITATVTPGGGTVTNVQADVSQLGGSATAPLVLSSGNVYTNTFFVASSVTPGTKLLTVTVFDDSPLSAGYTFTNTVVATNKVWNGLAVDNNWTSNPNWNLGGPGLAGDLVTFAGSTRLTPTMNANYNVAGVTFNGGGGSFTVGTAGSTLTLSGGVTNNSANVQTLNVPITLNSTQAIVAAAGPLTFGQAVANGANTITVTGSSNTVFAGVVSGAGGLTKLGSGTVTWAGGYSATGTIQVNGGTGVVASAVAPGSSEVWAGAGTGSVGTINVSSNSTLTVNNWVVAGRGGTGTINVNGGTLVHAGSGNITLGTLGTTPVGTLNLNSGTISNLVGETWVGEGSSPSENVGFYNQSGGYAYLGNFIIGRYNGGANACRGTATLTGGTIDAGNIEVGLGFNNTRVGTNILTMAAGTTVNASGYVRVAFAGGANLWGILTNNGGTLNVGTTALYLGFWDPCQGSVTLNSGQINLRNNASIIYGQNGNHSGGQTFNQNGGTVTFYSDAGLTVGGTGSLNLGNAGSGAYVYHLNGGTLTVPQVRKAGGSSVATFNFNGGTLKPTANSTTFLQGLSAANVQFGGAIIDTDGKNITVNQALPGGGGLTKKGAGTLTLAGANTYTGNTVVSNGSLALNGSGSIANSPNINVTAGATFDVSGVPSTFTLGPSQTLSGNGNVTGAATVLGTIAPGSSIGTLTFATAPTLNGTLRLEINRTNAPTADRLVVNSGTLTLAGTLTVTNLGAALQSGDNFQLLSAPNVTGAFAVTNLPLLDAGLAWNFNATSGVLSVVPSVANSPTNLAYTLGGGSITLSWPEGHTGWRLQTQTNALSTGLDADWFDVAGSTATNVVTLPVEAGNGCVFYRLVYP
jgi:fibronectin-binding autotransporter adhesin